jgi:hypothetical protein
MSLTIDQLRTFAVGQATKWQEIVDATDHLATLLTGPEAARPAPATSAAIAGSLGKEVELAGGAAAARALPPPAAERRPSPPREVAPAAAGDDEWVTTKEASKITGRHYVTILGDVREGRLKSKREGRHTMILRSSLANLPEPGKYRPRGRTPGSRSRPGGRRSSSDASEEGPAPSPTAAPPTPRPVPRARRSPTATCRPGSSAWPAPPRSRNASCGGSTRRW